MLGRSTGKMDKRIPGYIVFSLACMFFCLLSCFDTAQAQGRGQIKIFIVDTKGNSLPRTVPAVASIRAKADNASTWDTPHTSSNEAHPPDFTGTLALSYDTSPDELVAVGVYLPTGYQLFKMVDDVHDCSWQSGSVVPNAKNLYQLYAPSHPTNGRSRQTVFVRGPSSGTVCITFMLVRDPAYSVYAKLDYGRYGRYAENPWSSRMGLQNVRPDEIVTLKRSSTQSEVQIDVSKTIGATIVHFYVGEPGHDRDPSRIQLIKSADAADSGLQWGIVARGIDYDSTETDTVINQAVGADPTWMWGLEVPLQFAGNDADSSVLKTPDNVWVPLYSDHWSLENADRRWDHSQFLPNSPLFQPLSLRLWDGRVEEISLKTIPTRNGHTISQVTSNFHVRSHLLSPVTMEFYRSFLWSVYNSGGPFGGLTHRVQIFVVKADGSRVFLGADRMIGSLEQSWPIGNFGQILKGVCSADACAAKFKNVSRVVLVYDPCPSQRCVKKEQVISIHLPNGKPFAADINMKGGNNPGFGVFIDYFVQGKPLGAKGPPRGQDQQPFVMMPDYNNGDDGMGDTIMYSVGSNADLNDLPSPAGY